ncbi:protein phosphatase 2C family protein [Striga asiatica]|uniref:Protein phosphatase 2C family protein n=1 Tax=Striga asiatica TaxID=4170 RepID=A0A5A7P493_STRAF|nr:protein phosphatase 2C family protein [Striga asiatica]
MADENPFLLLQNRTHQFSDSQKPQLLKLATESPVMERGPRFNEYSQLRERKLRSKKLTAQQTPSEIYEPPPVLTPQRKQVKFGSDFATPPRRPRAPSALTQSVPDFSSALRKENRKPAAAQLPPVAERSLTPPEGLRKGGRGYGRMGRGSKSTNSAEKRSGGLMAARKSYANMEELKRLAVAAGKEINGGKTDFDLISTPDVTYRKLTESDEFVVLATDGWPEMTWPGGSIF